MEQSRRGRPMRVGLIVFIAGTIANVVEFSLANTVQQGVLLPIMLLALVDAAMIAYFFMHVTQLWHPEE